MKFTDEWKRRISIGALILSFGADLTYALINLWTMATTIPGKILLPILGGVVVSYKAIARQNSKNAVWWIGAVLTFYFAVSFSLTELAPSSENRGSPSTIAIERENAFDAGNQAVLIPPSVKEAKRAYNEALTALNALKAEQANAGKEYRSFVKDATDPIAKGEESLKELRLQLESERTKWLPIIEQELTAQSAQEHGALSIFSRLPNTLAKIVTNEGGNGLAWALALFAFCALFAFVEAVLYVTCGPDNPIPFIAGLLDQPPKRPRHVQPKPVSPMLNIVTKLYYNSNRTNGNNRILKFGSMSNYLKGAIGKEQYHEVVAKLKTAGLVSEDGIILNNSPEKAMEVLK